MGSEPNAWKEIERMRANAQGLGWPRALVFRKALSTGCLVRIGPRTCPSNCYSLTSGKITVRCVSGDISASESRGSAQTALHFTEHPRKQCLVFEAGADMDPNPRASLERQQLRLRERQKFFEDILQPETEFVFPLSHFHLEAQRPPIGSISSMEVNVDTLEQVELIDLGDQDGADVFLPCEDPPSTPQTSGVDDHPEELRLPMHMPDRTTSRTSSSSSDSSTNLHSPNPSVGGADTPLAQSDEEDGDEGGAEPGASS
ncbi:Dysbindin domain-containing protein 2 [Myotis davidii]|uniref:Dysbindin domain-containing protein 2 n=2 Tax=Myotis TaxID=9434 RepID=L5MH37_MYODS|nr:Dysbindin domain-containing protein 2 [Myotis davidii]